MPGAKRKSFEAGHRPKFLVIADDSSESDRALRFAARRAGRIGAGIVLLAVIERADYQHWLGIGDKMEEEARDLADQAIERLAGLCRSMTGIEAEREIRIGSKAAEIIRLIEEDQDISFLVLGAGTEAEGPGPLVSMMAGRAAASFAIPVVIVPGALTDADIDALA